MANGGWLMANGGCVHPVTNEAYIGRTSLFFFRFTARAASSSSDAPRPGLPVFVLKKTAPLPSPWKSFTEVSSKLARKSVEPVGASAGA